MPTVDCGSTASSTESTGRNSTILYIIVYVTRKFYNFYIDLDLADGLKAIKARDGISESEQIRRAIRTWLEAKGHRLRAKKGAKKK